MDSKPAIIRSRPILTLNAPTRQIAAVALPRPAPARGRHQPEAGTSPRRRGPRAPIFTHGRPILSGKTQASARIST